MPPGEKRAQFSAQHFCIAASHNDFVAMFEQDTREEAEKAFYTAVSELPNKKLKDHILAPFWDYVKTVENWKDMILNYFDAAYEPHRSNGPVEQWNRNINRVFNDGNGYSFKHLREKMLLGNDKIKLSKDFKFVPASTNHVYTALSAYAGAEGDYSEQTMQYLHSIVRGIAKTPEMKGNTFVAEVVKNIEVASFSMLREVLVTYPSLSFRVAEELDDHLSAQGRVEILGVSLDEFNATYDYIRAQINAHLEDESILTPPRSSDVEDPDKEDDFDLSEDF